MIFIDCFLADNLGRGQRRGEDVAVGAVRSGEVHARLLLRYSGHWIHGRCLSKSFTYRIFSRWN